MTAPLTQPRVPGPRRPDQPATHLAPTSWTTQHLVAFLGTVSACRDEATALQTAVEAAAAATDSEVGAVVVAGRVRSCIGFGRRPIPTAQLLAACTDPNARIDIPGFGPGEVSCAEMGRIADAHLLVARGSGSFGPGERGMIAAMANVLCLTLDVLSALGAERTARESSELTTRQVTELLVRVREQRQLTLERFSRIQRAIAARSHLTQVLDAITTTACELLECDVALLRVQADVDAPPPTSSGGIGTRGDHRGGPAPSHAPASLLSATGLTPAARDRIAASHDPLGIGRRAEGADEPVVDNAFGDRPEAAQLGDPRVCAVIAVPVRQGAVTIGHLVLGSRTPGHRFTELDSALAVTLAEHAGLAVQDARTVHRLHAALAQARHQATHDALTGLANRAAFLNALDHTLAVATLHGYDHTPAHTTSAGYGCLLYVDLDHFKSTNDTHGHLAGDDLLVATASRLREAAGGESLVARLGGDEFVVLAVPSDHDGIADLATRVLDAIRRPIRLSGTSVTPSASVGVTRIRPGQSTTEVLTHADLALYEAKRLGRGRFVLHRPDLAAQA